jgi:hypothetical protein
VDLFIISGSVIDPDNKVNVKISDFLKVPLKNKSVL